MVSVFLQSSLSIVGSLDRPHNKLIRSSGRRRYRRGIKTTRRSERQLTCRRGVKDDLLSKGRIGEIISMRKLNQYVSVMPFRGLDSAAGALGEECKKPHFYLSIEMR